MSILDARASVGDGVADPIEHPTAEQLEFCKPIEIPLRDVMHWEGKGYMQHPKYESRLSMFGLWGDVLMYHRKTYEEL
jgi:hypothetical protein